MKYTKLYSQGEPELTEGDIFRTIIPLVGADKKQANNKRIQANNRRITGEKQANSTGEKKRAITAHLEEYGRATVADFADIFKLSEGRVRAILLEMTKENLIEKVGKTRSAYYILGQK